MSVSPGLYPSLSFGHTRILTLLSSVGRRQKEVSSLNLKSIGVKYSLIGEGWGKIGHISLLYSLLFKRKDFEF